MTHNVRSSRCPVVPPFDLKQQPWRVENEGERRMDRKIIIRLSDFNKEIYSFLMGIGADNSLDWNIGALDQVRHAVVDAFGKMGVTLEVDDELEPSYPLFNNWISGEKRARVKCT